MRVAPQWSHVSACPPSAAVRQAAMARSAARWTAARRPVARTSSPHALTMSASVTRGRALAAVRHTAHAYAVSVGTGYPSSRSSGDRCARTLG